ncbi:hypothetical protein PLESTM_000091800 [Pleodorina starrii]|nr:hypothetical protein PLESTM_000091800 [Pleodorina starrii]
MSLQAPGELTVTVEFAKGLQDKEWVGRQDPYCVVRVGGQSFRSKTAKDGGTNPVWDQAFTFKIESENDLEIDIKDDELLRDEPLGTAVCTLSQVRMRGSERIELPVRSRTTGREHGTVCLSLRWTPAAGFASYPAGAAAYGTAAQHHVAGEYGGVGGYGAKHGGGEYGSSGYGGQPQAAMYGAAQPQEHHHHQQYQQQYQQPHLRPQHPRESDSD